MNASEPRRIEPAAAPAPGAAELPYHASVLPLREDIALLLRDHAALLLREIRYELLRWLRTPSFALPTLLFPPMFYLLFGVVLNRGNPAAAVYLMASYGVFGVMAPALFGFGVGLALDRERGLLTLKPALPVPPGAMLLARTVLAMLFALAIGVLLQLLGSVLGGVHLALPQRGLLLLVDVLGTLPFCAIGLYIGARVGGSGAPALVNLIYLPIAFLSGLWIPLQMLPSLLTTLAPLWPSYHLGQLALRVVGQGNGSGVAGHIAALLAVTVAFFALAHRRLRRG
ncbi:ABC transporter permease [Xanthomonas graminis]|jgi:ABC-2 type transport system permease protein|uniref:Putative transport permease yvfS n=1 Tax=Xanthomonas graminis pv. graminis TaxID=134874 RepID=A0A1M4IST6_9XANT|nr:ABC transporter permease [Xanthomonas translucens]EKU23533.1 Putative transport permease yvfS [Xanthomonas translucens pv. graminis ART-Xtg29]OAX61444.1 ABC transporter permease [Xanthomonas translucens pv. graminis]UKE54430.1 ABC transporter permease [Xanthomonas translucens pv. graminis]WIH08883.1 ABC transporter permease [Xanthomonas translucens pv. graminis]WIH12337.1 ABC transporter permease [Xanthomonas translucens pv. graminis]